MSTQRTSFQELINGDTPVLVDFFAEWCGPCKMMAPILDEFKGMVGDRATVIKIDVDKNPGAAQAFGVRGVPTLIVFKGGKEVGRSTGDTKKASIDALLSKAL